MKTKIQKESYVLDALKDLSPESSKNTLKAWVEQGRVFVNETRLKSWNKLLKPGQDLKVGPKIAFAEEGIKILYEDRYLVVVDKPEGLLSVASLSETEQTVHSILKRRLKKRVFPAHRLDKGTSGVLVFAYTLETQENLKNQFMLHTIERMYYGIVKGHLSNQKGTWRSYLAEDELFFVKSRPEGKLAITHYEVAREKKHYSLVKFNLETGRKNQIRVQAADCGNPILGDTKYGKPTYFVSRLCLHAHVLGFTHPTLNKPMRFTSPLPPLFTALCYT